ncbi:MAG: hypothetical protein ACFFDF_19795 [Candidatus Odinarchaeota archaeon]
MSEQKNLLNRKKQKSLLNRKKQKSLLNRKKQKSPFQKHIESIRKNCDKNQLSHSYACKIVSCDFGIEKLKIICSKAECLDFGVLINVYHKLEKIFFKKNLYPSPKIKCGITIYLKYKISKKEVCNLCNCCENSLRASYYRIKDNIRIISEKLPFKHDSPPINLSDLFSLEEYSIECDLCSNKNQTSLKRVGLFFFLNSKKCSQCGFKSYKNISYIPYKAEEVQELIVRLTQEDKITKIERVD